MIEMYLVKGFEGDFVLMNIYSICFKIGKFVIEKENSDSTMPSK